MNIKAAILNGLILLTIASPVQSQEKQAKPIPTIDTPPPTTREFRGVWVASVANIDFPSKPGLTTDQQN
jgi:uncharacterized lipoprotein YddW (UPF0748 family)